MKMWQNRKARPLDLASIQLACHQSYQILNSKGGHRAGKQKVMARLRQRWDAIGGPGGNANSTETHTGWQ